jgi:uncharacterized protein
MTLEDIVNTIAAELHPEKIILFGSHARGEATPDSDYDLFVIVPYDGDRHVLGARARDAVRASRVPLDIIVYPRSYLEQRLRDDDSLLLDDIFHDGKVVYEAQIGAAVA